MKYIPYGRHQISKNDIIQVSRSLKEDFITTGNYVKIFERKLSKKIKSKYVLTCNSGTSALHLAFLSIGLKKDDIVLMPSINFIASFNICKLLKTKVHLVDVDPFTGQMTPEKVLNYIKKKKIKKHQTFNFYVFRRISRKCRGLL